MHYKLAAKHRHQKRKVKKADGYGTKRKSDESDFDTTIQEPWVRIALQFSDLGQSNPDHDPQHTEFLLEMMNRNIYSEEDLDTYLETLARKRRSLFGLVDPSNDMAEWIARLDDLLATRNDPSREVLIHVVAESDSFAAEPFTMSESCQVQIPASFQPRVDEFMARWHALTNDSFWANANILKLQEIMSTGFIPMQEIWNMILEARQTDPRYVNYAKSQWSLFQEGMHGCNCVCSTVIALAMLEAIGLFPHPHIRCATTLEHIRIEYMHARDQWSVLETTARDQDACLRMDDPRVEGVVQRYYTHPASVAMHYVLRTLGTSKIEPTNLRGGLQYFWNEFFESKRQDVDLVEQDYLRSKFRTLYDLYSKIECSTVAIEAMERRQDLSRSGVRSVPFNLS